MKTLAAVLFVASSVFGSTPALVFTKSFPGSEPAFVSLRVDQTGALEYKESPKDDHPVVAQLQPSDTSELFAMAEKLNYFKSPLESGLKVANTGKKTFRYEDGDGKTTEVSFNYSTDETAAKLLEHFEQIASSERAYLELDRTVHFDKLGVNDALANIESLWLHKQLAAPAQFIPLLDRIAGHESFMHLARDRAARLKDQFTAVAAGSPGDTKSK